MIYALALLVLAQGEPCYRTPRAGQGCGYRGAGRSGTDLPFFSAFDIGGAGAGAACPLPNWILQSDNFQTSWTMSADSAPRNIVFTADYDGVADRLQIPATVPAAQFSRIVQGPAAGWPGGPMTCSVQIKGTSGAGTIPVYALTGFPANKTICSFNSTSYTTCSLSWTSLASGSENFYIGPSGVVGDGSFPAIDVLLKNAQCNAGSVVAPYVATTTVPATSWPTGAKGEALTFARTSTATCTKTAAGGLATTGIANGDLVTMSAGQPRVEYDSAGTLGLLVESSRQNVNLQSADLANVVYTSVGAPTVTANTTVAPDNTTSMATIQDNSAAALEGRAQTVIVTAAAAYTMSVFVKAGTLSAVTLSLDGTTATCATLSATTATRCSVTDASSSGVAIVAQVTGGTVIGDTGTFIAWGQQVEPGSYMTSYIPTTSAAVTRVAETASFPVVINTTNGFSHAHSFTLESTTSFSGGMGLYQDALNRSQLYQFSSNALNADYFSTSGNRAASNVPGLWNVGQTYRIAMSYSGAGAASTVSSYLGGVLQNTGAAGITSAWTSSAFGFSINSPWSGTDAIHSRLCADPLNARCR